MDENEKTICRLESEVAALKQGREDDKTALGVAKDAATALREAGRSWIISLISLLLAMAAVAASLAALLNSMKK